MLNFRRPFGHLWFVLLVAGCSVVDGRGDLAYRAESESKSPLSTLRPLRFRVDVVDQRDVADARLIGYKRSGLGNVLASIRSNQEVPALVRQALEAELGNNGHGISSDDPAKGEASLMVRLKKVWTEPLAKIFDVQVLATVSAEIHLRDGQGRLVVSRTIAGGHQESWPSSLSDEYGRVLNRALREFVRNVARDGGLLNGLREIAAE